MKAQVTLVISHGEGKHAVVATKSIDSSQVVASLEGAKILYVLNNIFQLSSERLMTKAGRPLQDPVRVLAFFNELAVKGWSVDKSAYIKAKYGYKHHLDESGEQPVPALIRLGYHNVYIDPVDVGIDKITGVQLRAQLVKWAPSTSSLH